MWSLVDESTAALMVRVYRNLRVGKSLPEALRAAMLQLAGRALMPEGEAIDPWDHADTPFCMLPFSRPLHWAGLVVVGQVHCVYVCYMYISLCIYTYTHTCVCVCVCVCVYIYM